MRPINLLPPEAFQRERTRRAVLRLVLLLVAYLGLLLLVTIAWSGRISAHEEALAQQEATNADLERRIASFGRAAEVAAEYEENARLIQAALADDVSWGRLLNDLGRMIPDRVWLEGLTGTAGDAGNVGGALGRIQVTGMAFAVPDVSAWVRALDSDRYPGVGSAWVSSVTETSVGEAVVVRFVSESALTDEARSRRADLRIPEVGG
ncbi:MAG TPA: hypothetical protein ENK55_07695 [Actinobacteria bacterium]|nr:hypothetical protein [Actinomycetota bacterium]